MLHIIIEHRRRNPLLVLGNRDVIFVEHEFFPVLGRADQTHAAALLGVHEIHRRADHVPIDPRRLIDETLPRSKFVDASDERPLHARSTE